MKNIIILTLLFLQSTLFSCSTKDYPKLLTNNSSKTWVLSDREVNGAGFWGIDYIFTNYCSMIQCGLQENEIKQWFFDCEKLNDNLKTSPPDSMAIRGTWLINESNQIFIKNELDQSRKFIIKIESASKLQIVVYDKEGRHMVTNNYIPLEE